MAKIQIFWAFGDVTLCWASSSYGYYLPIDTAQHNIVEVVNIQQHCCENLRSHIVE